MNPRHVTASFAIVYIHHVTNGHTTLTIGQLRIWAHRGHIHRVGTDQNGFALYDLTDVIRHVSARYHPEPTQPV
jgi:hypothetical protein